MKSRWRSVGLMVFHLAISLVAACSSGGASRHSSAEAPEKVVEAVVAYYRPFVAPASVALDSVILGRSSDGQVPASIGGIWDTTTINALRGRGIQFGRQCFDEAPGESSLCGQRSAFLLSVGRPEFHRDEATVYVVESTKGRGDPMVGRTYARISLQRTGAGWGVVMRVVVTTT